jgi:hypothetical protein
MDRVGRSFAECSSLQRFNFSVYQSFWKELITKSLSELKLINLFFRIYNTIVNQIDRNE